MTQAQIRKLETIIGKLEALQGEVGNARIREELRNGKSRLFDALTMAETGKPVTHKVRW